MTKDTALTVSKHAFQNWNKHKAPRLGAALAFYTMFSIAPLLIIVIAITGMVFRDSKARIMEQIQTTVGPQTAAAVQQMIEHSTKPSASIIASLIGVVTLLLGAAGVFGQLKDALNTIWEVQPKPSGGILNTLKQNFLSFGMVLAVGFLLLTSLVISASLAALTRFSGEATGAIGIVWEVINNLISFGVLTLLFSLIYRVLPDEKIPQKDVWFGAIVTTLLFTIGKFGLGIYLGRSGVTSAYGAAGSLVLLLLWIYYSSQILFFGAELTKSYAVTCGSRVPRETSAESSVDTPTEFNAVPNPSLKSSTVPNLSPNIVNSYQPKSSNLLDSILSKVIGVTVLIQVGKELKKSFK